MGMLTSGRVEIAAPAADVWAWMVDPVKLTAWLGAAGGMPEDPAELHVGWSATNDTPAGSVRVEITAYEPPTRLTYRSTYEGGDSISDIRLVEAEGRTIVTMEGDTDWARPKGGMTAAVEAAMAGQPESAIAAAEEMVEHLEEQLTHGDFDAQAQPQMQQALDAQLQKLKTLVEGEQTAKK